ncbi:MAG: DUF1801 domain-containing protein [Bacteroidota bacterium]
MTIKANSPEAYISKLPEERQAAFARLRQILKDHLPEGFEEQMSYGMIGYVVPKSIYPEGYHADPKLPLPFINLGNQKNYIALYHSGIYADDELKKWFEQEYAKSVPAKLDIGKSCIRFKKMERIPFDLIAELAGKMSVQDWVARYEQAVKR